LLSILNPFRRGKARRPPPPTDLFRIDLGPVDEPMTNGHTERMNFSVSERIALGKGRRPSAPAIGRAVDRDFDWKSVHTEEWPAEPPARDDHNDQDRNGSPAPPLSFLERPEPASAYPLAPAPSRRAATHELADVVAGTGSLTVQGVQKTFGKRMVVRGVSLAVRRGEAVGLLGPNGAGKTTVFYMITGLIKADKGAIQFDGHDITHLPMYQRARLGIGYLPQEASIFRGLNVEDNIRAVLEVVEPSKKKREMELDKLLEEFNITRLRKTPSIALSGGERRRTEIARALATRPSYMLLDEPFAGIDPIAVGDIQQLVRHLTERGIGVLITDHNVRETLGLTDRAYIIYAGEVLREGRAEDIINDPEVRRLYLGEEFRM
jgi:lipopolysaccharide export system ATP-binding protein